MSSILWCAEREGEEEGEREGHTALDCGELNYPHKQNAIGDACQVKTTAASAGVERKNR